MSPARARGARAEVLGPGDLPLLLFRTTREWDRWLGGHGEAAGVWMRFAKKGTALRSISYTQALDVALCHGWIDSLVKKYDAESYIQRFTPRGPRSVWSKVNRGKVEALAATGRMKPAGRRAMERAKETGRWQQAYDAFGKGEVPADLQAALDRNRKAKAHFEALSATHRYPFIFRVQTAVRADTRARRIAEYVAILARGESLHSIEAARRNARQER